MPIHVLEGALHADDRGNLKFFNSFDMREIVRLYEIAPSSTRTIRGWQGHLKEKKWFYCTAGSFVVNLVGISNDTLVTKNMIPKRFILNENNPMILEVPSGYASGFKALEEHSKLMVFSDFSLEQSKNDDIRFPLEYWKAAW